MNSYLRLYYYNNKVNLTALRENLEKYNLNININKDFIKPKNKRKKFRAFFGFISSLSFFYDCYFIRRYKASKALPYIDSLFLISFLIILILVSIKISKLSQLIDKKYKDNNIFIILIDSILIRYLFIFPVAYIII